MFDAFLLRLLVDPVEVSIFAREKRSVWLSVDLMSSFFRFLGLLFLVFFSSSYVTFIFEDYGAKITTHCTLVWSSEIHWFILVGAPPDKLMWKYPFVTI